VRPGCRGPAQVGIAATPSHQGLRAPLHRDARHRRRLPVRGASLRVARSNRLARSRR
jgi:hypothetical protein